MRSNTLFILLSLTFLPAVVYAQSDTHFNVQLIIDYQSADRTVELYDGLSGSPQQIAQLRGSQIAAATSTMLAHQPFDASALERDLQAIKFNQSVGDDLFRMKEAKASAADIRELLTECKRRNFGQRVVSTVEQLFPEDTRIRVRIPVYFVAFGHQNIDAYVQRVVWVGNTPAFVGEGNGELTIIVNLAKAAHYGRTVDERFIGLLTVVGHEVFHAAFGAYKDASAEWQQYYQTHHSYLDQLLDLTQNEGIAYYFNLVQRSRGILEPSLVDEVRASFETFNRNAAALLSPQISAARAGDLIQQSNTSGYENNYGALTGMIIARQIDRTLGRDALRETITLGPVAFFRKYVELSHRDDSTPPLSEQIIRFLNQNH
jgi:hypothetical protein